MWTNSLILALLCLVVGSWSLKVFLALDDESNSNQRLSFIKEAPGWAKLVTRMLYFVHAVIIILGTAYFAGKMMYDLLNPTTGWDWAGIAVVAFAGLVTAVITWFFTAFSHLEYP